MAVLLFSGERSHPLEFKFGINMQSIIQMSSCQLHRYDTFRQKVQSLNKILDFYLRTNIGITVNP
jgi:hypothetical protein